MDNKIVEIMAKEIGVFKIRYCAFESQCKKLCGVTTGLCDNDYVYHKNCTFYNARLLENWRNKVKENSVEELVKV